MNQAAGDKAADSADDQDQDVGQLMFTNDQIGVGSDH